MNGINDKFKFNSLRIIIYFGATSYIILGKHMKKLKKKITNMVCCTTQVSDYNTNYTRRVYIVLPESYLMEIMT